MFLQFGSNLFDEQRQSGNVCRPLLLESPHTSSSTPALRSRPRFCFGKLILSKMLVLTFNSNQDEFVTEHLKNPVMCVLTGS